MHVPFFKCEDLQVIFRNFFLHALLFFWLQCTTALGKTEGPKFDPDVCPKFSTLVLGGRGELSITNLDHFFRKCRHLFVVLFFRLERARNG